MPGLQRCAGCGGADGRGVADEMGAVGRCGCQAAAPATCTTQLRKAHGPTAELARPPGRGEATRRVGGGAAFCRNHVLPGGCFRLVGLRDRSCGMMWREAQAPAALAWRGCTPFRSPPTLNAFAFCSLPSAPRNPSSAVTNIFHRPINSQVSNPYSFARNALPLRSDASRMSIWLPKPCAGAQRYRQRGAAFLDTEFV